MNTDTEDYLISSNVDVAPNEYVLKYSYNRNFLKLCKNDAYLLEKVRGSSEGFHIESYNKKKTYRKDEYVFYKTSADSQQFYLLKSLQNANQHKPLAIRDDAGNIAVVNGDWWMIVGIPYVKDQYDKSPKSTADEYVQSKHHQFVTQHEEGAHPTGELGFSKSNLLFKNLTNIDSEQTSFMYPSHLQKVNTDNSVQHGYLRKWDNGLLEYDLVFKLGVVEQLNDGKDLISANSRAFTRRNSNNLYFKENDDYSIFASGGPDQVVTDNSKQVNLNPNLNAYSGLLRFQEPFKDTNYMIFTSNVKNVDIEAASVATNEIANYDPRLKLTGLAIDGYQLSSQFKLPLTIPSAVVNIKEYALAEIQKTDNYPVDIQFEPGSKMSIINEGAFTASKISKIEFPSSLRYIGSEAFARCDELTQLVFHLKSELSAQPRIERDAFAGSAVSAISVIYDDYVSFKFSAEPRTSAYTSKIRFEQKLSSVDMRMFYGLTELESENIYVNRKFDKMLAQSAMPSLNASDMIQDESDEFLDIDVQDFFNSSTSNQVRQANVKPKLLAKSPMKQSTNWDINTAITVSDGMITNFDPTGLSGQVELKLSDLTSQLHGIAENALSSVGDISELSLYVPSNIYDLRSNIIGKPAGETGFRCSIFIDHLTESNTLTINESAFYSTDVQTLCVMCNQSISVNYLSTVEECYLCANSSYGRHSITGKVNKLHIQNGPKFSTRAISAEISELHIDFASGGYLNANACEPSSRIDELIITNIAQAGTTNVNSNGTTISGLYTNSLSNANIDKVIFTDVNLQSEISVMFETVSNKNRAGLNPGGLIKTVDEYALIDSDSKYVLIPDYLKLDSAGTTLVSCYFDRIQNRQYEDIIVPNVITCIAPSAMQPPNGWPTNSDYDGIKNIYLPPTIKQIGNYAFANNTRLKNLIVELSGEGLTALGTNIVAGCLSVNEFSFDIH